ncbi:calcium-binding protein [Salipiger abyssi]|uniref:Putative calcium-binding protein n=1 Tax=Salipiger abyssi TaxID=1250539 RepID=A0A1P8UVS0_9RHOB|nr:calcium-binding protein [Salipiger abyssi]APZ53489.1 putative calcium-binding protein [Salipiger abyssi]
MADITGTDGNDNGTDAPALIGTQEDDVLNGFAGDDLLQGLGGDDFLSPGAGADTVQAGDGDDQVFVWFADGRGYDLDGGEGFDRLILQPVGPDEYPPTFYFEEAALSGFEQIDLNGNRIRLAPSQLEGITRITGFGPEAELRIAGEGTTDLRNIMIGEDGSGTGRINMLRLPSGSEPGVRYATWDATGAASAWHMSHGENNSYRVHMIGGAGDDTLSAAQGDTVDGGAGDDRILSIGHSSYVADRPYSVISGGDGTDVFVGARFYSYDNGQNGFWYYYDHSRTVFDGVEVLEGGGTFTRAAINDFSSFRFLDTLRITTPGELDLNDRIESIAPRYAWDGELSYKLVIRFVGNAAIGANDFALTDHWVPIRIEMGRGADTIETGIGRDTVISGAGNDTIRSGDGQDRIYAGEGDDFILTWTTENDRADWVRGDSGDDSIETGAGNDLVNGGVGDDTIDGGTGFDTLDGGAGNDVLTGGTSPDDIADLLIGRAGDDLLRGGAGNDQLMGGDHNDTLEGEGGSDTLEGGYGDDLIAGGALSDVIIDGFGMDFINGGFGSDRINLLDDGSADRIFHAGVAGHGSDWIRGFAEEDALVAADGLDASDFIVQRANTAGAGLDAVDELFVSYAPTGQILWALVDGDALTSLTLRIDEVDYDLLA